MGVFWLKDGLVFVVFCEFWVVVGMLYNGYFDDCGCLFQVFFKFVCIVCGVGVLIVIDVGIGEVVVEVELVLVIGLCVWYLILVDVFDVVFGIMIVNDVMVVDQVLCDSFFMQVKNGDGFMLIGLWIEMEFDVVVFQMIGWELVVEVDGMLWVVVFMLFLVWNVVEQLVYVSLFMELGFGDVLFIGVLGIMVFVVFGQFVWVWIEGFGVFDSFIFVGFFCVVLIVLVLIFFVLIFFVCVDVQEV